MPEGTPFNLALVDKVLCCGSEKRILDHNKKYTYRMIIGKTIYLPSKALKTPYFFTENRQEATEAIYGGYPKKIAVCIGHVEEECPYIAMICSTSPSSCSNFIFLRKR